MTGRRRFLFYLFLLAAAPVAWADDPSDGKESPSDNQAAEQREQRPPPTKAAASKTAAVEEIVVLGRADQPALGMLTLSKEASAWRPTATVAELLEREPAVVVSANNRGERLIHFHGFEQKQLLLLVDGLPVAVPYDGLLNLDMLPSWLVEHLTIVKSPGASVYGPNGLGGAINIVTPQPGAGPVLAGSISGGRAGDAGVQVSHSWRDGRLAYSAFGGYGRRDAFALPGSFTPTTNEDGGLRQNSDKWSYQLGLNTDMALSAGHRLMAGVLFTNAAFGVPPSTIGNRPRFWRFTHWRMTKLSLGHRYDSGDLQSDEIIYGMLFDNLLDSYDDATYSSQESRRSFHSWYHDRIVGGRVRVILDRQPAGTIPLRFGLWLGMQHDRHAEEQAGLEDLPLHHRSLLTAAPRVECFPTESWSLGAGLQIDYEFPGGNHDSSSRVGPSFFARWGPSDNLVLQASVSRQGRFPTLRELYSSAPGRLIANPRLAPESAWHFNLEASLAPWPGVRIVVGAFDAEVADLIEREPVGGGVVQPQNIGSARFQGVDLSLSYRLRRWLSIQTGYSYLRARRLDVADNRLEYRPAHKVAGSVAAKPLEWLELELQAIYTGPQDYRNPDTDSWERLDGWFTLGARMAIALGKEWRLWVEGSNLTDALYETEYGQPAPGLYLGGGVEFIGKGDW